MIRLSQDPTDHSFQQAPWAFYEKARATGDFIWWDEYDMPMAMTHAAVDAVLKSRALGRARPSDLPDAYPDSMPTFRALERNSLLELEPPDHRRLRREVLRAFTSARIASLSPDISRTCDLLAEALPCDRPFDVVEALARPLPVLVIAEMIGVSSCEAPRLVGWSTDMVAMYQAGRDAATETAAEIAAQQFDEFIRALIEAKRRTPGRDLVSALIAAQADGNRLSEDEIVSTVILLLNAGHEATVHAIGNGVRLLAGYPQREAALAPEAIEGTVEEILRTAPPLHIFTRYVYEPVEIEGVRFEAGQTIGACLGSACHDDAQWPAPERFNPFRPILRNTAFGAGIHFCLGAPLARLELKLALPILFGRCPGLRLVETPRIAPIYHFHGHGRLMVAC